LGCCGRGCFSVVFTATSLRFDLSVSFFTRRASASTSAFVASAAHQFRTRVPSIWLLVNEFEMEKRRTQQTIITWQRAGSYGRFYN